MPPNWAGSTILNIAGAIYSSITKSSANFETADVRDIDLRCLFISRTGFSFGIGVMLAFFQERGRHCSWKDALNKFEIGDAIISV